MMVKLHPRAGGETGRRSRLKIYLPRGNKSSILFPPILRNVFNGVKDPGRGTAGENLLV
jgi:hypothetical protein